MGGYEPLTLWGDPIVEPLDEGVGYDGGKVYVLQVGGSGRWVGAGGDESGGGEA